MKLKKYSFKKVTSTNNSAIRFIKNGIESGIIISDEQTKGRGQRGNKWLSKKGNLFMTVFFEINKSLSLNKIIKLNILIIKKIIKKKNEFINYYKKTERYFVR